MTTASLASQVHVRSVSQSTFIWVHCENSEDIVLTTFERPIIIYSKLKKEGMVIYGGQGHHVVKVPEFDNFGDFGANLAAAK